MIFLLNDSVIDHVPEALCCLSSICVLRRDRVKAGDNCKALVKCPRLVPLGPLSHSWHPAWVGPLQHAWGGGGGSCPMLPRSSIDTAVLCLGFSALWAQRALDCIETKNKQINKTKGERQTKRAGSMAGFSICLERSAFGLWNDSTRHRLPTHVPNEKFESKRPARCLIIMAIENTRGSEACIRSQPRLLW